MLDAAGAALGVDAGLLNRFDVAGAALEAAGAGLLNKLDVVAAVLGAADVVPVVAVAPVGKKLEPEAAAVVGVD